MTSPINPTLTPDQIRDTSEALAWIRSHDPTFPIADDPMILAWAGAFAHYDLSKTDLFDGVNAHFRDIMRPRDRVLPADIIRPAREARRQRAEHERASGTTNLEALSPRARAIADCERCDPNGWIETRDGRLRRCTHHRELDA